MRDLKKHSYSKEYHDCYMEDYKKKVRYPDVKQDIIKINEKLRILLLLFLIDNYIFNIFLEFKRIIYNYDYIIMEGRMEGWKPEP